MANTLIWHGPAIRSLIFRQASERLDASAILVLNRVRALLSVPGPEPSRPGEAPHKQWGRLRASYTWDRNGMERRVGSVYGVAEILEKGSRRVAARPHLRPAFRDSQSAIRALWARPLRLPR